MRGPVVAFGFLTRLPMGRTASLDAAALSRAAAWFPLVGVVVGALMGGVHALAGLVLDPASAAALAVLAAVLATGGFHEDGAADTADAAGAHVSRARRLEILRDPRVGTYGALALIFCVVLPVTLLGPLDDERFLAAAVSGHVLGRWSSLPLSWRLPTATASGSGALLRATGSTTLIGTAATVAIVLAAAGLEDGALMLAVAGGCSVVAAAAALRLFGGVTGDVFGAANKTVELAVYATSAALWA